MMKQEEIGRNDSQKELVRLNNLLVVLYAYNDILKEIFPKKHAEYIQYIPQYKKDKTEHEEVQKLENFCLKNPKHYTNEMGEQIRKSRENYRKSTNINKAYKALLQHIIE
jgi:hypothetical protein